jgi:hypothetical protein
MTIERACNFCFTETFSGHSSFSGALFPDASLPDEARKETNPEGEKDSGGGRIRRYLRKKPVFQAFSMLSP